MSASMAIPSSSSASNSTSTAVNHASAVPPYISLQEVIEPQEGVTGLIITDHNGLLITCKYKSIYFFLEEKQRRICSFFFLFFFSGSCLLNCFCNLSLFLGHDWFFFWEGYIFAFHHCFFDIYIYTHLLTLLVIVIIIPYSFYTAKGDLCEDTSAASRRAAGHFVQAVKTASTLSESGAEHVTVTIDCAPAESTTDPTTGKLKARQIVLTKTSDFYLAVSSAEKN